MNKSTSINDLPKVDGSAETNQDMEETLMVNSILKDLENDEDLSDTNQDSLNYTVDSSQIPPKVGETLPSREMIIENTQNIFSQENTNEKIRDESEDSNNNEIDNFLKNKMDGLQINNKNDKNDENKTKENNNSLINIIISKIKYPIIVIVLFFILSQPKLDKLVIKILPKLGNTIGNINMLGILLKSVLAGLVTFASSYVI